MAPEPSHNKHEGGIFSDQGEKQKNNNLDQEVKELISKLTNRLASIQRTQKSHVSADQEEHEDDGVGIITLAGSNIGATMRGAGDITTDEKSPPPQGLMDQEDLTTYVNSNFQAVNNSILLGGSYKTNDPGVHLDISSDYFEHRSRASSSAGGHSKHGKKKINHHDKESSKSDHHTQHSDD